jgi:hypothetical protein
MQRHAYYYVKNEDNSYSTLSADACRGLYPISPTSTYLMWVGEFSTKTTPEMRKSLESQSLQVSQP